MTEEFKLNFERWGGGELGVEDVNAPNAIGEAYACMYNGRFFSLLLTRGGMYRGDHVHPNKQHTLLLEGKGKYVLKNQDGSETVHELKVGEVLEVDAGTPHVLLPETDCLTFEWWEGPFIPQPYGFTEHMVKVRRKIEEWNSENLYTDKK
jgi:mannose-6-phosphate isomerase-like protein (cupin superfamily)